MRSGPAISVPVNYLMLFQTAMIEVSVVLFDNATEMGMKNGDWTKKAQIEITSVESHLLFSSF